MKKILRFSLLAGLFALVGSGLISVHMQGNHYQQVKAEENVTKYLAMNSENFYRGGFSDVAMENLISARNETFHDGKRSYNSLENFLNTMARVGEHETGWVRSVRWVHKGGYVSFLLGGNSSCFVNIWAEPEEGKDNGVNIHKEIKNDFHASRNSYDNDYLNGNAGDFELSANMAFRFFNIPDEYIGRELIVYIEDNATSYYGGVTFGDLRVNQTLEEVALSFAAHKQQIALDAKLTPQNNFSATYMLEEYYAGSAYDALNAAIESIDNVDDGFERYGLTNWAYDRNFATADINFATIVSDNDAKDWTERMPANKTGNYYINADTSYIDEAAKYRLISPEFTLSGNGLISAKLGGGTAVLSLIDSDGEELATTRLNEATGTNILNRAFVDNGGVGNIMLSRSRFNTMARTYLDCSDYLGQKVRVVLSDDRTGGNWGLAYFDEVITKYDFYPSFKVDRIHQQFNENPTYHGVVLDQYVGDSDTTFGQAYDFVTSYYNTLRNLDNGGTWCSIKTSDPVQTLIAEYNELDTDVQAIVSDSMDYSFDKSATFEDFFENAADVSYSIGQTIEYIKTGIDPLGSNKISFIGIERNVSNVPIIFVVSVSFVAVSIVAFCFIMLKRKKKQ